jgi:hypothetical protein
MARPQCDTPLILFYFLVFVLGGKGGISFKKKKKKKKPIKNFVIFGGTFLPFKKYK